MTPTSHFGSGRCRGTPPAGWVGVAPIALLASVVALALSAPASAASGPMAAAGIAAAALGQQAAADRAPVRSIQSLLAALGFDPGQIDGLAGRKTRRAIRQFQRSQAVPEDGAPSLALHQLLRRATERRHAAAPAKHGSNGTVWRPLLDLEIPGAGAAGQGEDAAGAGAGDAPPPAVSLLGTRWRFVDNSGARFTLEFKHNGTVDGVGYAELWHWSQSGPDLHIRYDNGMGATITRLGSLSEPRRMTGTARTSGGKSWSWTAERLDAVAPRSTP